MGNSHRAATPAAGGVLWRPGEDSVDARHREPASVEIALAHRPRYDDWTLPKGKLHHGEQALLAAVREVGEETGASVEVGRRLTSVEYRIAPDVLKRVHYWSMRYLAGQHVPNDEVDEIQWLSIAEAMQQVTYPVDRSVLADFARLPADTRTVVLVRHAKAGKRSQWKGEDSLRPLEKIGRRHARDIADILSVLRPVQVLAADRVRCVQTVGPLAEQLGLTVQVAPDFSDEACELDAVRSTQALLELAETPGTVVICSQGGAIPTLLEELMAPGRRPYPARKGSAWVLSFATSGLIAADYYPHSDS